LIRVHYEDISYFVDFRLQQIRRVDNPHDFTDFIDIRDENLKATLRGVRAMQSHPAFMRGLDD